LPVDALSLCDRVLRGMRGAAISVASIDLAQQQLTFAGIGNVEGRLFQASGAERLISYRGIIGVAMRTVRAFHYALDLSWLLVLHTDGVSARFEEQDVTSDALPLDKTAGAILKRWGRERDDATVVLVRPT
jgi:hypothetical protein